MEKMQKFIINENGKDSTFYLDCDLSSSPDPLFCPICNFIMKKSEDFDSFRARGCCLLCDMEFAQQSYKKWENGWRPTKKQINKHIKNIEKRTISLFAVEEDI
jgi:hypothetical protein